MPTCPQSMQLFPITTLCPICKDQPFGDYIIKYDYQWGQTEKITWIKLSIFEWSPITVSLQLHNQIGDIISLKIGLPRNLVASRSGKHLETTYNSPAPVNASISSNLHMVSYPNI